MTWTGGMGLQNLLVMVIKAQIAMQKIGMYRWQMCMLYSQRLGELHSCWHDAGMEMIIQKMMSPLSRWPAALTPTSLVLMVETACLQSVQQPLHQQVAAFLASAQVAYAIVKLLCSQVCSKRYIIIIIDSMQHVYVGCHQQSKPQYSQVTSSKYAMHLGRVVAMAVDKL